MDEDGGYESKHDEKIIYRVGSNFVVVLAGLVLFIKKGWFYFLFGSTCVLEELFF